MARHGQSLPRTSRIRQGAEIRRILKNGRRFTGAHLTLICLTTPEAGGATRAGFLSPRRLGPATARNRARRRLRELFRTHRAALRASPQILFMGRPSTATASFEALRADFFRLCRTARLLPDA
ncbi:MAG: ribonuclease P protein component [Verrucomicrobiae bacterium]|nr:ribonuclease P protein component [Verrucomicrobiae bacterium]